MKTTDKGVATIDRLLPGRYRIQAEFPGFEIGVLPDVRVRARRQQARRGAADQEDGGIGHGGARRAGGGRRSARQRVRHGADARADRSAVGRSGRDGAAAAGHGRRQRDHPHRQLRGRPLPPKAQIKSIHITRDAFAAENHSAGGLFIDIITQPGHRRRSAAACTIAAARRRAERPQPVRRPSKGPERTQNFDGNVGGSLIKEQELVLACRSTAATQFDTPDRSTSYCRHGKRVGAARAAAAERQLVGLRPRRLRADHAIRRCASATTRTASRAGQSRRRRLRSRPSAPTRREQRSPAAHPGGRTARPALLRRTRGCSSTGRTPSRRRRSRRRRSACIDGVHQRRRAGARRPSSRGLRAASDLDYVRGIHTVRTGIQLDGGHYRSDDASNYLGTYTVRSLAAFDGTPAQLHAAHRRSAHRATRNVQAAVYVQDDIRVRKNLTFSPGLRYEAADAPAATTTTSGRASA